MSDTNANDWSTRRFPVRVRPAGEEKALRALPLDKLVRAVERQQVLVDQHMLDAEPADAELRRIRAVGGPAAAGVSDNHVWELATTIDRANTEIETLEALTKARDWRRSFEAGEKSGERHGRILMWLYWWPGRRLWLLLMILGAAAASVQMMIRLFHGYRG